MKYFKLSIYYSIMLFSFICCEKKELIADSHLTGKWKFVNDSDTAKENLIINADKSFSYSSSYRSSVFFSKGKWDIVEDTLVLNSVMPKECFHVIFFGGNCPPKNIVIDGLIPKTIVDCTPKTSDSTFIDFRSSKFILKNDSLLFINTNKNCSEIPEKIILYR